MSATNPPARSRRGEEPRLIALLDGKRVGQVHQDQTGRFRFIYDDEWRDSPNAYPLSLAMPLSTQEHAHDAINAFLWGLLPDNHRTLSQYARRFGVSAGNPVALLAHMGADCAGAVQFAPADGADALIAAADAPDDIEWLSDDQVAELLRDVRERGIPRIDSRTAAQFSLAGAQPKIALLEEGGRWARPAGRTPTNRILKPPSDAFDGFAENEHFCLELARALELGAARSRVMRFAGEVAIVVDRFDRTIVDGRYHRVHQEDVCQALGILPDQKYESEGGPGIRKIVGLLRDASQEPKADVDRFLSAMALNWVLAATDGHAKNYALLHGPRGATRLAPFYDIASYLPDAEPPLHRVKLAMKIGSEYLVKRIGKAHWEQLAKAIGVPTAELLERVEHVAGSVVSVIGRVRQGCVDEGLDQRAIDLIAERIGKRARACLDDLHAPGQLAG